VLDGDRLIGAIPQEQYTYMPGRPDPNSFSSAGRNLVAADVADPTDMRPLGHTIPVALTDACAPWEAALICPDYGGDLRVLDLSSPEMAAATSHFTGPADGFYTSLLATRGSTVFAVGMQDQGGGPPAAHQSDNRTVLRSERLAPPSTIEILDSLTLPEVRYIRQGLVDGQWWFGLTDFTDGSVLAVDISDPTQLRDVGKLEGLVKLSTLAAADGLGLGATGGDVVVLDLSAPPAAPVLGRLTLPFEPRTMLLNGQRAYVAGLGGLAVLDLSVPSAPRSLATIQDTDMDAGGIRLWESQLYLYGAGAVVYDVSDPTAPRRIATYRLPDPQPDFVTWLVGLWVTPAAVFVSTADEVSAPTTMALRLPRP